MTRHYPKRKDFIASHQRLVERRRKDDIATLSGGGGGAGSSCVVGFMADTSLLAGRRCWPFNRIALNTGGFTVDMAHVNVGTTGTAIVVPSDGIYQFGLAGYLQYAANNPPGTTDLSVVQESNTTDVIADGSNYTVVSQLSERAWIRTLGVWHQLLGFESYLQIASEPVTLAAGDPVLVSAQSTAQLTAITANGGAGNAWTVELWVRALA